MLTDSSPVEADDHASADDRRNALGFVTEAFAEAIMTGLSAESFAHAALFAAFQELVETFGEDSVAKFAERLPQRVRDGEFTLSLKH